MPIRRGLGFGATAPKVLGAVLGTASYIVTGYTLPYLQSFRYLNQVIAEANSEISARCC